jgi:hypothetical protein
MSIGDTVAYLQKYVLYPIYVSNLPRQTGAKKIGPEALSSGWDGPLRRGVLEPVAGKARLFFSERLRRIMPHMNELSET